MPCHDGSAAHEFFSIRNIFIDRFCGGKRRNYDPPFDGRGRFGYARVFGFLGNVQGKRSAMAGAAHDLQDARRKALVRVSDGGRERGRGGHGQLRRDVLQRRRGQDLVRGIFHLRRGGRKHPTDGPQTVRGQFREAVARPDSGRRKGNVCDADEKPRLRESDGKSPIRRACLVADISARAPSHRSFQRQMDDARRGERKESVHVHL